MRAEHIPNLITVFRIFLVIPIVDTLLAERFQLALGLFILAGISDALDGFLAKRFDWQSHLGSLLDPLADKLLLVSCFVTAGVMSLLPPALVIAVVARDLLIVSGASAYYLLVGPFEGEPLLISKLNTLVQLVLIVAVLTDQAIGAVPSSMLDLLIVATLLTTVVSGVMYVYLWGKSYWHATHEDTHQE